MTPVLLPSELVELVGGRRRADRALRDDSWQRVLPGTYVPGSATTDLHLRCRAAGR